MARVGYVIGSVIILMLLFNNATAQKLWDGEGGDGQWNTAANWVGNTLPLLTDDVVLNNQHVSGNYIVTMPAGNIAVTIRTITISPVAGSIELVLPSGNTAIPGLVATGPGFGMVIQSGGIFRNASGASSGTPVTIADSIRINNGGRYIHNCARAHASNVTVLSTAPGTENGTFEFNVPGGAGYTISITGRTYGNLVLSASAAGGSKSYTSTGSTALNIKGRFTINTGVNYSLNFSSDFIIHQDLEHQGNTFDISGGVHNNTVALLGNLNLTGTITKTGTGLPVFEFRGSAPKTINASGNISGSILIRMNNPAGVQLQTPFIIQYGLLLVTGRIQSTTSNPLIVLDGASCNGGSVKSFIDGPLRKIGDEDFLFPIGKGTDYSPITLEGTGIPTDEFEAEYFTANPLVLFGSAIEPSPVIRVSSLEYWQVLRTSGSSLKKITLNVGIYSNATLLEKLAVVRWDPTMNHWSNAGNSAYTGIATGTITSNVQSSFGIVTLGSTVEAQNPLPFQRTNFKAITEEHHAILSWQLQDFSDVSRVELMESIDDQPFRIIKSISKPGNVLYREKVAIDNRLYKYQLKIVADKDYFSEILSVSSINSSLQINSVVRADRKLIFMSPKRQTIILTAFDFLGRSLMQKQITLDRGRNVIQLERNIHTGHYLAIIKANGQKERVAKIIVID